MLWDTCKAELKVFAGLLPLLQSSWSAAWSSSVYCFDSSLYGWGVCKAVKDARQVMGVGRLRERDGFCKEASTRARERAFDEHTLPVFSEADGLWLGSAFAAQTSGYTWVADDSFAEVPQEIFGGS